MEPEIRGRVWEEQKKRTPPWQEVADRGNYSINQIGTRKSLATEPQAGKFDPKEDEHKNGVDVHLQAITNPIGFSSNHCTSCELGADYSVVKSFSIKVFNTLAPNLTPLARTG